jgi:hypothetical protein
MTVDASRSCLGLGTWVGSAIRQMVDARALPTAAMPPALPARSASDGSLAPPLLVTTRFLQSTCRYCDLAGDSPDKAGQFAGDRRSNNIGGLAASGEAAIARAQPHLPFPGDVADQFRLVFWRSRNSRLIRPESGSTTPPRSTAGALRCSRLW